MALVYPIYLDTPMMTAFLASLEGGFIDEASFESHKANSEDNSKSAGFSLAASNLLSNLFGVGAQAELAKKISENLESDYKSTVKYPNSALFIRLRDLLMGENLIKPITSPNQLNRVSLGDLVEFSGFALPSPAQQMRIALKQIMPLLEPYQKVLWGQLQQSLTLLKSKKVGEKIKIGEIEVLIENQNQKNELIKNLENQKELNANTTFLFNVIKEVLDSLIPEEKVETLLIKSSGFNALCNIYSMFAREERIQDIHNANWHCLGKVLEIIDENQSYDLLKSYPIGYIARAAFPDLANAFRNESLNIAITEPTVPGPGLTIATLAIFA